MTMTAFRIDQPFPSPQNAPDFVAAYTQAQVQANPSPDTIARAYEIVPWMQYLRSAAPYITTEPLLAMAWGMLAMDGAKRAAFAAALEQLDKVSQQEG